MGKKIDSILLRFGRKLFFVIICITFCAVQCFGSENLSNFGDTGYFNLPSVEILPDSGMGANYSNFLLSSDEFDILVNNVNFVKAFSSEKNLGYSAPPENLDVNNLAFNIKYLLNKNMKNSPSHIYYGIGCMFNAAPSDNVTQDVRNILNVLFQGMGEPAYVPMPYIVYGSVTPTGSMTLYLKVKGGLGIGGGYRARVYRKFELVILENIR